MKNRYILVILVVSIASMFLAGTASARTGGPDEFGYTFIDNEGGGPIYKWYELSCGSSICIDVDGTEIRNIKEILPNNDDSFITVDLAPPTESTFNFTFYGINYSKVNITNNGLVLENYGTYQYINEPINESTPHNFIAPFWDDIVTLGSGTIYTGVINPEGRRKFIVEWVNNQHFHNSDKGITFEAILDEETHNIIFVYNNDSSKCCSFGNVVNATYNDKGPYDNGSSATVGIEGSDGKGLQYSFNQQYDDLGLPLIKNGRVIIFQYPGSPYKNLIFSKSGPMYIEAGKRMTYTLYYSNTGSSSLGPYTLKDILPSEVNFVDSPSSYTRSGNTVAWNINLLGSSQGYTSLDVDTLNTVPNGTVITNTAQIIDPSIIPPSSQIITTSEANTTVNKFNLPAGVDIGPASGSPGGTPSVYWQNYINFTYNSPCATTSVSINIHIEETGKDIIAPMHNLTPLSSSSWNYIIKFYPDHGTTSVKYSFDCGSGTTSVVFKIYIDPAGYVYDISNGERIQGATVWLMRPDGFGEWEIVPTNQTPSIMQPDINPLKTNSAGQYQWDTLNGTYRVYVTAYGYYPADSRMVTVPPPVFDLNVGLTRIDPTSPVITPTVTGTEGNNGWYTSDVTVNWSVSDPESGISSSTGCDTTTLSADTAGTTLTCTAANGWGFSNSNSVTIKIDKTPPSIEITAPANGANYTLNQPVAANYSCSDALSGVATCTGTIANGSNIDTGTVGSKSFTVDSTDSAGNAASATNTYNIVYNFTGFFQPTDNLPTLNALKAGSAVPVKFSLSGYQGLNLFEAGYPGSAAISCDSTAPVDDVNETVTAGSSNLSYDATTDQYNYIWKTDKDWTGTCRQLVVMLNDGTYHRANFKFVK